MLGHGASSGTLCQINLHLLNVRWVQCPPQALGSEVPPKAYKAHPGASPHALQNPIPFPLLSEFRDVKMIHMGTSGPIVSRAVLSF